MGSQFTSLTVKRSVISHEQERWVPRSDDKNGGGYQGGTLVMMVYGEDSLFDALEIRDTEIYMSTPFDDSTNPTGIPFDQVYAPYKTALVTSTLDQSVSLQPVWSRDQTNWYAFGTATTVSAYSGTGAAESATISLSTPTMYLPYVGLQATCATAPTSGELNAWLERLG